MRMTEELAREMALNEMRMFVREMKKFPKEDLSDCTFFNCNICGYRFSFDCTDIIKNDR